MTETNEPRVQHSGWKGATRMLVPVVGWVWGGFSIVTGLMFLALGPQRTPRTSISALIAIAAFSLIIIACSPPAPTVDDPEAVKATLSLAARPVSDTIVEFVVTTDAPTPIQVAASVSLAGQEDLDTHIGHSEFVTLTGRSTTFNIDTAKADRPIPTGIYDAEVNFYRRWGAKENPAAAGVDDMAAAAVVELRGSGQSRETAVEANVARLWVMENVVSRTPWNKDEFVRRLGPYEKLVAVRQPVIEAYYFPRPDMTILVYAQRDEVMIWRMGRATD